MSIISLRLKGGALYEDYKFWKELSKEFPEIEWTKQVAKCTRVKYFVGGNHFKECDRYKKWGGAKLGFWQGCKNMSARRTRIMGF